MNSKINCWEYKNCGRESGGIHAERDGICPASLVQIYDGINGGINGGRICWFVEETICDLDMGGSFMDKFERCVHCNFYLAVQKQQARHFTVVPHNIR